MHKKTPKNGVDYMYLRKFERKIKHIRKKVNENSRDF